ncbi:DNA sulfur modification protein DndB [Paenibacillus sp. FSL P4-0176]|uniref:DNA sulfur modification protein DndB n=1 Tax=Paenibacillus sp. FSL P4-0176 TaxID=2921631 RepID=UPI0030CBD26D
MKLERIEIEKRIIVSLNGIKNSRKSLNELNTILSEYNVPFGIIESINSNAYVITELELPVLIGISIALYDLTKDNDLHTESLFGDREIRDALDILNSTLSEKIYLPLPFSDVIKIKDDSYVTKISVKQLVKMFESQLIIYDYEAQRGANYKVNKSGGIVKTPVLNKASVKRIAGKMSTNDYFEDMITFNVYSTEIEPLTFHEEQKTLIINNGSIISIVDGFHRLQGAVAALHLNPNLELDLILSIRSYDQPTAQKFFGQLNTINVLNKVRRNELSQVRMSDKVVSNLQRKSEFGKRIVSSTKINELNGDLTTFDILSYAIDKLFKIEKQFDVLQTADYLDNFFVYLLGTYSLEFSQRTKESTGILINHPLMFIGYTVIAKYMQDNKVALSEIKDMINKIDFEDENLKTLLNEKGIAGNSRVRNSIVEYFESLFRGVK